MTDVIVLNLHGNLIKKIKLIRGAITTTCLLSGCGRSIKYEEVYLKAYQDGRDARIGLGNYFRFYKPSVPTRPWVTGHRPRGIHLNPGRSYQ